MSGGNIQPESPGEGSIALLKKQHALLRDAGLTLMLGIGLPVAYCILVPATVLLSCGIAYLALLWSTFMTTEAAFVSRRVDRALGRVSLLGVTTVFVCMAMWVLALSPVLFWGCGLSPARLLGLPIR